MQAKGGPRGVHSVAEPQKIGQLRSGTGASRSTVFGVSARPACAPVFDAVPIVDAMMGMAVPPWRDGSAPLTQTDRWLRSRQDGDAWYGDDDDDGA